MGTLIQEKNYIDAIISWHEKRNGVTGILPEHIGYENGVLGGVLSVLNVLCSKGDKVLLHSPTYIRFTSSLENSGYKIIHSPLVLDENQVWRMDFEDMEKKIKENHIHAAVFALLMIHVGVFGNAGKLKKLWKFIKSMMYLLFQMKSSQMQF